MEYKKTSILICLLLSSAMFLGACNDNKVNRGGTNSTIDNDTSNDLSDDETGQNPADTAETSGFRELDLEIDFAGQEKAIGVNYNESRDSANMEYKNTETNQDVNGDEAWAQLRPLLRRLDLKEDMTEDQIVSKIIEVFKVPEDYTSLEAEITWLSKEKRTINITK